MEKPSHKLVCETESFKTIFYYFTTSFPVKISSLYFTLTVYKPSFQPAVCILYSLPFILFFFLFKALGVIVNFQIPFG
jgi:hypothetical protein